MSFEKTLTPNQRFYLGQLSAEEAVRQERERVRAERSTTGYSTVDKIIVLVGVVVFLPLFLFEALHRR